MKLIMTAGEEPSWCAACAIVVHSLLSSSDAPEPQYTILREPVEGELPQFLVIEVQLPAVVSTVCALLPPINSFSLLCSVHLNSYRWK